MMHIFTKLKKKFPFFISRTNLIINEFKLNQSCIYVWGMKISGQKFRINNNKVKNFRIEYLEDGFIHSFGKKKKIPLSISKDKNGIYYNYKSKSDLFSFIKEKLSDEQILRSKKIISLWKECKLSKYNYSNFILPPKNPFVLLIDQTFGDLSINYGGADNRTFQEMYDFAVKNWPGLMILIKIHPDVIAKRKKGCINENLFSNKNVKVVSENGQINKLIESCKALCVVTSQVGFEGLIYGKEVHVFGRPFYAGLGLTIDHYLSKGRKKIKDVTLEQLVYSALIKYQIFLDPRSKKICEIEKIIDYINKQRKIYNFFPSNINCLNLTPWKARQINRFIKDVEGIKISFFRKYNKKMENILFWGKSIKSDKYISSTKNFISVEDGFIRSVGLGGDLISPMSLLFDKNGIHYDPSKKSDLEELLQNRVVKNKELNRSKELIEQIKIKNISKYNLIIDKNVFNINNSFNKKIVLVLGQVETDNSIIYGVPGDKIEKTNYSLVRQVKKDFPNYYIIYKPHPDLEQGLRSYGSEDHLIGEIADFIANKSDIQNLFKISDRVAVFTSLGGFEALIRGIKVTTYGFPFYAGWGLTEDKFFIKSLAKRRTRILSLEELVFISLIDYPYYYSLRFNCHTEIEELLDELDLYKNKKKSIEQIIFRYWGSLKDYLRKKRNFK